VEGGQQGVDPAVVSGSLLVSVLEILASSLLVVSLPVVMAGIVVPSVMGSLLMNLLAAIVVPSVMGSLIMVLPPLLVMVPILVVAIRVLSVVVFSIPVVEAVVLVVVVSIAVALVGLAVIVVEIDGGAAALGAGVVGEGVREDLGGARIRKPSVRFARVEEPQPHQTFRCDRLPNRFLDPGATIVADFSTLCTVGCAVGQRVPIPIVSIRSTLTPISCHSK